LGLRLEGGARPHRQLSAVVDAFPDLAAGGRLAARVTARARVTGGGGRAVAAAGDKPRREQADRRDRGEQPRGPCLGTGRPDWTSPYMSRLGEPDPGGSGWCGPAPGCPPYPASTAPPSWSPSAAQVPTSRCTASEILRKGFLKVAALR